MPSCHDLERLSDTVVSIHLPAIVLGAYTCR
jgi:hypothetical protein